MSEREDGGDLDANPAWSIRIRDVTPHYHPETGQLLDCFAVNDMNGDRLLIFQAGKLVFVDRWSAVHDQFIMWQRLAVPRQKTDRRLSLEEIFDLAAMKEVTQTKEAQAIRTETDREVRDYAGQCAKLLQASALIRQVAKAHINTAWRQPETERSPIRDAVVAQQHVIQEAIDRLDDIIRDEWERTKTNAATEEMR